MRPATAILLSMFFSLMPLCAQSAEALCAARAMDSRTLAAQVLLAGIDGKRTLDPAMAALLRAVPAGGIMLFRYNLSVEKSAVAPFVAEIRAAAAARAGGMAVPPLVAVDHEGGVVHRFGEGFTRLPPPLSWWEDVAAGRRDREAALAAIEESSFRSGMELRNAGIVLNLAPVAEILGPENGGFLGSRSYGPDPAFVAQAAAAFIRGMERAGILCAVKHFPGNAGGDPHERAVSLAGDRAALAEMVRPMSSLIGSGRRAAAPFVMVSHARVPAWDRERSASLSPVLIREWLRGELGFDGVVLADDFSMAGSGERENGRAAVAALAAGIDMVMCWPANLAATHRAILRALETGELERDRLVEAAARILTVKMRAGLLPEGAGVPAGTAAALPAGVLP